MTSWKRIYYEYDPSFRVGAQIKVAVKVGDAKITVWNTGGLKVGDKVQILDDSKREPELRKITKIEDKVLTLDKPLTLAFKVWKPGYGYVGRLNAETSVDLYLPDASRTADTFDDAFVEVVKLEKGSAPIQWDYKLPRWEAMLGYAEAYFYHLNKDPEPDVFQLVGVGHYSGIDGN